MALAARLGAEPREHERFATAKVEFDGHEVDIASARSESYPQPGALPVVSPAAAIETDLGRRDFSVNAMAIPLTGEPRLIDPHGGRADLEAGLLRALHPESFADDPTRAIRAARYAARLGLELEPETEVLLRAADLDSVSADRRRAELLRLAGEETAPRGFALLREWGLLERPGRGGRPGRAGRGPGRGAALGGAPGARGSRPRPARRRPRPRRRGARAGGRAATAALAGGRAGPRPRPGRAGPGPGARRRVARRVPGAVERGLARDRRRRSDRRRRPPGPGPRPRPVSGPASQARRRNLHPRPRARHGPRRRPAAPHLLS